MSVEPREDQRDDPWEAARASQRDDVHAALAPRERVCPTCGSVQRDGGRRCANCGADLTARYARGRSRRKLLYAALAACAVAAASVPLISGWREDAAGERSRADRRQQQLEAAERARQARDARPVRAGGPPLGEGADPLAHRTALVARAESLIARDARGRVAAGTIDGHIRGAQCDPFPKTEARRAAEQDAATTVGRYDCVAYTSKFQLDDKARTGLFGYPYWLVIDYPASALVFCKVTPRAGEGGSSLAKVPVPGPCRDPAGPG